MFPSYVSKLIKMKIEAKNWVVAVLSSDMVSLFDMSSHCWNLRYFELNAVDSGVRTMVPSSKDWYPYHYATTTLF